MAALPPPAGKLCFIRFDLLQGEGDYAYGFKPAFLAGPRRETEWGVYVHKRGSVFDQLRSVLKLNVIYFFVDGLRDEFKAEPPGYLRLETSGGHAAGRERLLGSGVVGPRGARQTHSWLAGGAADWRAVCSGAPREA